MSYQTVQEKSHHTTQGTCQGMIQYTAPELGTSDELTDIVKHMEYRVPGASKISAHQIKNLSINMLNYLLYILNMCFSMGYFLDTFEHATMNYIPKGLSSEHQVVNYRPISLLDTQCKIFDKHFKTLD